MRSVVLVAILLSFATAADAKGHKRSSKHAKVNRSVATEQLPRREIPLYRGQSFGAPWSGHLANAARLRQGDRYVIRRPWRSYGTRTTVDIVHDVITDTLDMFPKAHVLAIGDFSAEHGGQITEHHSHQSGRDVDIGLFYKKNPAGYPTNFVSATADNLDCAATWKLVSAFAARADRDGGTQMMFLDFRLQGLLYKWAKAHGVSEERLERIFQFPHGRGASDGLVRHEPNHDNHLHVRFKCSARDTSCG